MKLVGRHTQKTKEYLRYLFHKNMVRKDWICIRICNLLEYVLSNIYF